jgi:hypothetical protein
VLNILVIEEIKRREQEQDEETVIPLQLPLDMPSIDEESPESSPQPLDRGIVIIDL